MLYSKSLKGIYCIAERFLDYIQIGGEKKAENMSFPFSNLCPNLDPIQLTQILLLCF